MQMVTPSVQVTVQPVVAMVPHVAALLPVLGHLA